MKVLIKGGSSYSHSCYLWHKSIFWPLIAEFQGMPIFGLHFCIYICVSIIAVVTLLEGNSLSRG